MLSNTATEPASPDKTRSVLLTEAVAGLHAARKPVILFYFLDFGTIGGIERYLQFVTKALIEEGHFEPVVVCSQDSPLYHYFRQAGIAVYGIPVPKLPAGLMKYYIKPVTRLLDWETKAHLRRIVDTVRPAIVHVQRGRIENLWFKHWGYPVVYTFHGYGAPFNPDDAGHWLEREIIMLTRPLFRLQVPALSALLFVSQTEQKRMMEHGFLPKDRPGELLYHGLDIQGICKTADNTDKPALRQQLSIPDDALCVAYINRIDKFKDPMSFFDVAEQIADQASQRALPPVHFIVAGGGHLEAALQERVNASVWKDRFHVLGHRDDVAALYSVSDLALFTPKTEGFGLSVLEAMACGTPVIAFSTGGIPEILNTEELGGYLIPRSDRQAMIRIMAEKAIVVLTQPQDERQRLITELQQRAARFNTADMMQNLTRVYRRVIDQHQPFTPLVSVVMAAWNAETTIQRAVRSVLAQTYTHWELVIVNDGASDSTANLLAQFSDPRIRVIHQENQGVAKARNAGIRQTHGEYVAFLDADDLWFPDFIETALATIQQAPQRECIAYHWYYMMNEQGQMVNLSPAYQLCGNIYEDVLFRESVLFNTHTLMHRAVVDAVGGFPEGCYHEDRVFYLKAAEQFPVYPTGLRKAIYQQSTAGRCRSVLTDYQAALDAELTIVNTLADSLTVQERDRLTGIQKRNLLYRFLMYNQSGFAKKLYNEAGLSSLLTGKKGLLARLSLMSGINLMSPVRKLVQWSFIHLFHFWWKWQIRPTQGFYSDKSQSEQATEKPLFEPTVPRREENVLTSV